MERLAHSVSVDVQFLISKKNGEDDNAGLSGLEIAGSFIDSDATMSPVYYYFPETGMTASDFCGAVISNEMEIVLTGQIVYETLGIFWVLLFGYKWKPWQASILTPTMNRLAYESANRITMGHWARIKYEEKRIGNKAD